MMQNLASGPNFLRRIQKHINEKFFTKDENKNKNINTPAHNIKKKIIYQKGRAEPSSKRTLNNSNKFNSLNSAIKMGPQQSAIIPAVTVQTNVPI